MIQRTGFAIREHASVVDHVRRVLRSRVQSFLRLDDRTTTEKSTSIQPKVSPLELEINEGLNFEARHFLDSQTERQKCKGPCGNWNRNEKLHQALVHTVGHEMTQGCGGHDAQHQQCQVG